MDKVVRLRKQDNSIIVTRLDDSRVEYHGFGTFFWEIEPEEVDVEKETLEFLKEAVNREHSSLGDLFGLSIEATPEARNVRHRLPHLDYGSLDSELEVSIEDVTIDYDIFKDWTERLG